MFKVIYKPVGLTPKQLQFKNNLNNYFHTGNLDMVASGKMFFVHFRLRFLEKFLKKLKKEYTFELICGYSTDTHDVFGLITNVGSSKYIPKHKFKKSLNKLKKLNFQVPPKVSYKNLNTKAKLINFLSGKKLKNLPKKPVKLINYKYWGYKKLSKNNLIKTIDSQINSVSINSRKLQIKNSYKITYNNLPNTIYLYNFKVKVSGGYYIRSLCRDLEKLLNTNFTVINLTRTKFKLF